MKTAVVVTVSDSVAEGAREDRSGPAVASRLQQAGWQVAGIEVVPDEQEKIVQVLTTLAVGNIDAIFTTGGTGLGPRDVTPEATRQVIDREAPGLAEAMRMEGRRRTPMAMLSRGVCGARGAVLIVNLPGSPKGAVDSLDAIVEVAPHAVDLLRGQTQHGAG